MDRHAVAERVRNEFLEMPGLRVTFSQAVRLWGLDARLCREVIDLLVGASFLRWTAAGMIVRADGTFRDSGAPPPNWGRTYNLDNFVA